MRFASLGSGSEGNGLLVECRDQHRVVRLLIDCGFGIREARRRLERLRLEPADLDAVLVTHEHSDHVSGVFRLAREADVPVYLTRGTLRAIAHTLKTTQQDDPFARCRLIDPGGLFEIDGVRIDPMAVPHDAREPVQYVIDDGLQRLGVVTDLGFGSEHVTRSLTRLDALLLECNHDPEMLANGNYPASLKSRIAGRYGHLSNEASARLLASLNHDRLRSVTAAHLSQSNNRPELARLSLSRAWGVSPEDIRVADQMLGADWMDV